VENEIIEQQGNSNWIWLGLLAVALLFSSLQLGINMGYNKGWDDGGAGASTKTVEVVREVMVSGNVTVPQKITSTQAVAWLKKDGTNIMPYDEKTFNCIDYAAVVKNNAELDGIRCGFVYIENEVGVSHIIVVFDTTDKGLLYAEPQFDWILPEPKSGMVYQ
jgi:hypothetical protein